MEEIKVELSQPAAVEPLIRRKIAQVRQMQQQFRAAPVIGALTQLKKMIYRWSHSTFSQQFNINEALLDLIETLSTEFEQDRAAQSRQIGELQRQLQLAQLGAEQARSQLVVASSGRLQDRNQINNIRKLEGLTRIYTAPAEMRMPERVVLYSLIFGLQPRYCLELGTFRGGSATIICGALDDTGFGQLVCVDPNPQIEAETWDQISHRCLLFKGSSPEILMEVASTVAAKFDFALIDGNHSYEFVLNDVAGILPLLADQAYLLFHDCLHVEVKAAIEEAIKRHAELSDCGVLSVEPTLFQENGQRITWAGLRLLKFQRHHLDR